MAPLASKVTQDRKVPLVRSVSVVSRAKWAHLVSVGLLGRQDLLDRLVYVVRLGSKVFQGSSVEKGQGAILALRVWLEMLVPSDLEALLVWQAKMARMALQGSLGQ